MALTFQMTVRSTNAPYISSGSSEPQRISINLDDNSVPVPQPFPGPGGPLRQNLNIIIEGLESKLHDLDFSPGSTITVTIE